VPSCWGRVTTTVDIWSDGSEVRSLRPVDPGGTARLAGGHPCLLCAGYQDPELHRLGRGRDRRFIDSLPAELRPRTESLLPTSGLDEDDYFAVMAEIGRETAGDLRFDLWFEFPGPQWVSDRFMQRIAERPPVPTPDRRPRQRVALREAPRPSLLRSGHDAPPGGPGILSPRFSIAHGCWLTEAEIAAMARTGAAISHNPSSTRLYAGIAPVLALREAGDRGPRHGRDDAQR
jgi:hypothetical protein